MAVQDAAVKTACPVLLRAKIQANQLAEAPYRHLYRNQEDHQRDYQFVR